MAPANGREAGKVENLELFKSAVQQEKLRAQHTRGMLGLLVWGGVALGAARPSAGSSLASSGGRKRGTGPGALTHDNEVYR